MPIAQLVTATGVSEHFCSMIRLAEEVKRRLDETRERLRRETPPTSEG